MVVMKLVVKVSSEKRRRRQLFPTPAKEDEEEEEIHVHFRLHRNAEKKNFEKLKPRNNNHQLKIRSQGKEDKQGFIDPSTYRT
jgi:hypothetical protein